MSNISFANINIQGRLTEDPERGTTGKGTDFTKFRVAVNKKMGKGEERTSFIPVVVFGRDAPNCAEYLSKGRYVMVAGEFETDNYVDRDGNKRTGFSVVSSKVIFGSGGRNNEDSDSSDGGSRSERSGSERASSMRGSSDRGGSARTSGEGRAVEYLDRGRGRGSDSSGR